MKQLAIIGLVVLMMSSCSKETSDNFVPYPLSPVNDTIWTPQIATNAPVHELFDNLASAPSVDSFNGANGGTIRFSDYAEVTFPSGSCSTNGAVVTGTIKVEFLHLRKKGDLVREARPTTSYGRLLESAGAYYIKATRNGQPLSVVQGKFVKVRLREPNNQAFMQVFYGVENPAQPLPAGTNPSFTWALATDSSFVRSFPDSGNNGRGYDLFTTRFNWVNCDYFTDTTVNRTKINVMLPPNCTNNNTAVFAVFRDQKIVVQLNPEYISRTFSTVNIPVGRNVQLVSLTKVGDEYYLGSKTIVTTNGQIERLAPDLVTKAAMLQFLDNL